MSRFAQLSMCLVLISCVQITDLRDAGDTTGPKSGQVDTGWLPDTGQITLPETISCTSSDDCDDWLGTVQCLNALCQDGRCEAIPVQEGLPCSDGDFRTQGDSCREGQCVPGPSVCVCVEDADCGAFDDGNQCNGRLVCDGCSCNALATPPGTECDDGDPATTNDKCVDDKTCLGTVPCMCDQDSDCPVQACSHSLCSGCMCITYPGTPGLIYASEGFDNGVPSDWSVSSTNPEVVWQSAGTLGLRAGGKNGSYDYGAAKTSITSASVQLPPGLAVIRIKVGLHSGEEGCGDTLRIKLNGDLVDELCGATETAVRTYAVNGNQSMQFEAVFESNAENNAGAGPTIEYVKWIRAAPSDCAPPTQESVIPIFSVGKQSKPQVAVRPEGWFVTWQEANGLFARLVDKTGLLSGQRIELDLNGENATAANGYIAWERQTEDGKRVVIGQLLGTSKVVPEQVVSHSPHLAGLKPAVVYIAETPVGSVLRSYQLGVDSVPVDRTEPLPNLAMPRVAWDDTGLWFTYFSGSSLMLTGPESAETLGDALPALGAALASGHGQVAAAWPVATGLQVRAGDQSVMIGSQGAHSPDMVTVIGGWVLAWTVDGANDSGVAGRYITKSLEVTQPLTLASYTFDNQDSVSLAPWNNSSLAVWRTNWFDGDVSGVVIRRIQSPTL